MVVTQVVELSPREAEFVRLIVIEGLLAAPAAAAAGYHFSSASALLRKPRIQAALLAATTNAKKCLDHLAARAPYGSKKQAEAAE